MSEVLTYTKETGLLFVPIDAVDPVSFLMMLRYVGRLCRLAGEDEVNILERKKELDEVWLEIAEKFKKNEIYVKGLPRLYRQYTLLRGEGHLGIETALI